MRHRRAAETALRAPARLLLQLLCDTAQAFEYGPNVGACVAAMLGVRRIPLAGDHPDGGERRLPRHERDGLIWNGSSPPSVCTRLHPYECLRKGECRRVNGRPNRDQPSM